MRQLLPALSRGMQRSAAQPGGPEALLKVLQNGEHRRHVEHPEVLGRAETVADGKAILGQILGSKDVSRNVAGRAAQETGLDSDLVRRMMPIVAAMVMGMLSKQMQADRQGGTGTPGAGSQGTVSQSTGSPALDILKQMLDTNQGGSVVDDLLDIARKFF